MARELLSNREAQPVEWGSPKTVGQMIGQLKTLDPAMETTALQRMSAGFRDGNAIRQVPISISFERLDGVWLAPYKGEGRKVLAFWAKADHREETERGELFTAPAAPEITDEAIDRIVVPLSPDGLDEEKHHCEWHLYHDRERIRKELREYFAAPPAPVNALPVAWEMRYWNSGYNCWHEWERITEEKHAKLSATFATDNDYEFRVLYDSPPARAVSDALEKMRSTVADPRALPRRKEWISGQQYSYVLLENVEAMVDEAWRAAMLAQPVSQRYTLPPHVFRELVNSLRDTAVKYSGTDQLRERLNTALHQFIEPDHPHTRTVAPEGGNDHDTRR